jgi:hypothetical protein
LPIGLIYGFSGTTSRCWSSTSVGMSFNESRIRRGKSGSQGRYAIVFEEIDVRYKLCRIIFGSDGSYFVTCPYYGAQDKQAAFVTYTVNYTLDSMDVKLSDSIDVASLGHPDRGLKLSHHPDGFLQFSGPGVTSGRDADGTVQGFGVMSWTLDRPAQGPAFGVTIRGLDSFETANRRRRGDITFSESDVAMVTEPRMYHVEGYFFPPLHGRFVRRSTEGSREISVIDPSGRVLPLRVLMPRDVRMES